MTTALLIINLIVTIALIGFILLQRSEGGGLGIGGGGSGGLMTGRGAANLLTHATTILATIFMCLCLALAVLNRGAVNHQKDILSSPPAPVQHQNTTPSKSS
ncbi:preprotein translocase subunit SecG [Acetobacteraceae bacterium]|nr:preprotein translocase subunit SecG [Acetobacteraceae bacterium]